MTLSARDCADLRAVLKTKATGYHYDDLARWLHRAGWDPPPRPGGSHRVWRHGSGSKLMIRDGGNGEVLPIYVKRVARYILEAGGCDAI